MTCALKNGESSTATEQRGNSVAPRVDILETENEFLLLADLPGVKPDEVDVGFEKGELTIRGDRAASREKGTFQRTFTVADSVAADRIAAEMKNGVLTVRLPKIEAVKPRKIAVYG